MTGSDHSHRSAAMIGLGIMGLALARNLLDHDFVVTGFDPDSQAADRAADSGVRVTPSAVEAVQGSAFVLTSLPSDSALTATVDLLTDHLKQEEQPVLVELSTLSLRCKTAAQDRLAAVGVDVLDCPVSGTGAQAQTRDIVLYVSGEEAAFNRCQTVFDAIARQSFFVGAFGNGMKMKFVANLLVAVHNVATAEALSLARQTGLDPQQVYDVISSGAGTSRIFELRGPMMVEEKYEPATMKLNVWQKDMALIKDFAQKAGANTPLFDATGPLYELANKLGLGEQDTAAVHKTYTTKKSE